MQEEVNDLEIVGVFNHDVERMVLATFINYPDTFYMWSENITLKDFVDKKHQFIYNSILELSQKSKIDLITVIDTLYKKKYVERIYETESINLVDYVELICDSVETDKHIKEHIDILNNYKVKRGLISLGSNIVKGCEENYENNSVIEYINSTIVKLQQNNGMDFKVETSFKNLLEDLKGEKVNGIKTGIKKLDSFIFQLDYKNFVVVAGAASMGKTAFALEIFKNAVFNDCNPVMFSLEMSALELTKRLVSVDTCIPLRKLRDKDLDHIEWKEIKDCGKRFKEKNYVIDDKSRNLHHVVNNIRKYVVQNNSKLVVVDYLQLVTCKLKNGMREQEIATISRQFKELAAELNIVIIALSQLNRSVAQRTNKRPVLSDLRESGAIEQDADIVIFPYRDAYYNMDKQSVPPIENVEIIIAKGRSTGTGIVDVKYCGQYVKFFNEDEISKYPKIQFLQHNYYSKESSRLKQEVRKDSDNGNMDSNQEIAF